MIELSPTLALLLYLGITTGVPLGLWLYHHYRSKRQAFFTEERALYVCEFCHHAYLGVREKDVTQCPQCQSFNKSNRYLGK